MRQEPAAQPRGGRRPLSNAVRYLADHINQGPVHVIPCVDGRTDRTPVVQASRWGRSSRPPGASCWPPGRGLGSVWTTFHLRHERQAAELLGIPFEAVMQVALIPVAYTVGTDFRPAARHPLDTMAHWEQWQAGREPTHR